MTDSSWNPKLIFVVVSFYLPSSSCDLSLVAAPSRVKARSPLFISLCCCLSKDINVAKVRRHHRRGKGRRRKRLGVIGDERDKQSTEDWDEREREQECGRFGKTNKFGGSLKYLLGPFYMSIIQWLSALLRWCNGSIQEFLEGK